MNVFLQGAALMVGLMVLTVLYLALTADLARGDDGDIGPDVSGWWIAPAALGGVLLLIGMLVEVAL